MSAEGTDTERSTVRTYVPAYQKEAWRREAEAMDVSLSEFVRTMVQAGRSDVEIPDPGDGDGIDSGADPTTAGEPDPRRSDPGGSALEDRILDVLDPEGYRSWDDLLEALTEDIEDRVESTLEELQRENRVAYSGRNGGYTLLDDAEN